MGEKQTSARAADLSGRRFGMLTVLALAPSRDGRAMYRCRCDCGGEAVVSGRNLRGGKTKSCGCLRAQNGKIRDLRGQRFSHLTALEPTEKRNGSGSVIWKCRCDCGRLAYVSENELLHTGQKSCGCEKQRAQREVSQQLHHVDGTVLERLYPGRARVDSTSGVRGVQKTASGSYRAYIGFRGMRYSLGTFDELGQARDARRAAEDRLYRPFLETWGAAANEVDDRYEKRRKLSEDGEKEHAGDKPGKYEPRKCRVRDEK